MTVPGYTAGSPLHRTGTVYTSVAARAGKPAGMVMAQQDPCAIYTGGGGGKCLPAELLRKRRKRAGTLCILSGAQCP
jgi:hypothetical protein